MGKGQALLRSAVPRRAGAFGVLVLSGEAPRADAEASSEAIDLVAPSLKEFGEDLERARAGGSMP